MMVPRPAPPCSDPRRCDCADYLRRVAEHEATGSRDFGRGFMHAARTLDRRAA